MLKFYFYLFITNLTMESKFKFFVSCIPTIEYITLNEINHLISNNNAQILDPGGIELTGTLKELYLLNLWLRTANRILIRLLAFYATTFKTITNKASLYPWEIYLSKTDKIIIKTTCRKSKIYHSEKLSHAILKAIEKRLKRKLIYKKPHEQDTSTQTIYVRMFKNKCTISIDSSGAHLHERGYHLKKVKAPIRETLAATMLYLSTWDINQLLWDPFCGSGTILIEAALIALNIAPGAFRKFAFMDWKNFSTQLFNSIERKKTPINPTPHILGTDISSEAINCAKYNAKMAQVEKVITLKKQNFLNFSYINKKRGFMVTNPPYGKRIGHEISIDFYKKIKKKMQNDLIDWNISLVCPKNIANIFCPPFYIKSKFYNGGIPVLFLNNKTKS